MRRLLLALLLPATALAQEGPMATVRLADGSFRMYAFAKEKGWDYNLAYIPEDFKPNQKEMLDKQEMKRLFKRGYDDAINGYKWHKTPPGYAVEDEVAEKTE